MKEIVFPTFVQICIYVRSICMGMWKAEIFHITIELTSIIPNSAENGNCSTIFFSCNSSLVQYIVLTILKTVSSARLLTMTKLFTKSQVSGSDDLLARDRIVIWIYLTVSTALSHIQDLIQLLIHRCVVMLRWVAVSLLGSSCIFACLLYLLHLTIQSQTNVSDTLGHCESL